MKFRDMEIHEMITIMTDAPVNEIIKWVASVRLRAQHTMQRGLVLHEGILLMGEV